MSEPKKLKKPGNTAFKQQRLKAWQPILTPKTVIPTFLVIGAIFIPIGIGLYVASDRVNQVIFDYTQCAVQATGNFSAPAAELNIGPVVEWKFDSTSRLCTIRFTVPTTFSGPVFMYYRLTNFYQNHRRYVKSFDPNQLKGNIIDSGSKLVDACKPFREANNIKYLDGSSPAPGVDSSGNAIVPQYYPCGLIANSLFTDEISSLSCVRSDSLGSACNVNGTSFEYAFTSVGIAWPSDKEKFARTKWLDAPNDADIKNNLVPPEAWRVAWPELYGNGYNSTTLPDISRWERLQVWMRTAGLPTFRKLWGKNTTADLLPGVWEIRIQDKFDVVRFGGTKSIVISTVSILGGKNPFLGIAYLVVGAVCVMLGVLFLARHMIKPRKLGDHSHLSWNKDTYQRSNNARQY